MIFSQVYFLENLNFQKNSTLGGLALLANLDQI